MLLLIIGGVGMPNYVIGSLIISLPMQLTMPVMVHNAVRSARSCRLRARVLSTKSSWIGTCCAIAACLMAGLLLVLDRDRFFDDERTGCLSGPPP
ncbi:hypothetical protein [Bradyrhizobium zhanjiangense]|uniref:Uncharacterized protein n=1 Tax=Bradyrhizobium zhanjiangense TaxID=1325107 RepID=A0ABY0DAF3_9BRAD|nr:hypothetical protein [Bradyrhizobium zhanjiangense]RXG86887.1 hypothetical protein EAS62_36845 [Bradyrhizobium zhanjiangense]